MATGRGATVPVVPAPRSPLPPALLARPFTVAEGYAAGMTRSQLRHPSLRAPFHGVRVPPALTDDLRTRCLAASLLLPPAAAVDGATAAALRGLPLPWHLDPARRPDLPVEVRLPPGLPRPRTQGLRVRRGATGPPPRPGQLLVASPAAAWAALGDRMHLDDLVVLGDAVARREGGLAALRARVAVPGRLPGRRRLRAALALVRERVDSPQETRLRLLVVRAGIPEPEVNRDATADGGCTWLATPDLAWHDVMLALEYLGDVHRTARDRWRKDVARREVLEDHGWKVLFATADDLTHRRAILVRRVEDSLRERGVRW